MVPMIEYYIGCPVDSIETVDSVVFFSSNEEAGKIYQNEDGNWEVYMAEKKVTEIEGKVFKTIMDSRECIDFEKYYIDLRVMLQEGLTKRSSVLIRDIMGSLEYLLINEDVKIKNPINIGSYFIFSLEGCKEIICLN